eukprot:3220204-Prymnesium_polylepis.1
MRKRKCVARVSRCHRIIQPTIYCFVFAVSAESPPAGFSGGAIVRTPLSGRAGMLQPSPHPHRPPQPPSPFIPSPPCTDPNPDPALIQFCVSRCKTKSAFWGRWCFDPGVQLALRLRPQPRSAPQAWQQPSQASSGS